MANDDKPRSPVKDAGWLILFLIVLGVIWFAQGGPSKLTSITSPFLESPVISPAPSEEEKQGFWESASGKPSALSLLQESPYKGKVFLGAAYGTRETDPQKEYLEIRTGYNKIEPALITGWTLKGKGGLDVAIGKGAYLVYSAQVNPQEPIFLKTGERAIIITGQSPIGTSFRLNICTGYFNQFQSFFPSLAEECPRLSEKEVPINFSDACVDFVKSLQECRMPMVPVPPQAGNDCAIFIGEKANYNGCVAAHKNDKNFYKPEWRIYLGRNKELWGQRDIITLRDQEGKIVDQISY